MSSLSFCVAYEVYYKVLRWKADWPKCYIVGVIAKFNIELQKMITMLCHCQSLRSFFKRMNVMFGDFFFMVLFNL